MTAEDIRAKSAVVAQWLDLPKYRTLGDALYAAVEALGAEGS